jgi:hypothetical protein
MGDLAASSVHGGANRYAELYQDKEMQYNG